MGENVQKRMVAPIIRFAGFTDSWEQRKFGELVLIQRGGSPRPIDNFITHDSGGINWIKIGDVSTDAKYICKTEDKITQDGAAKSRWVYPGDLILSNSMSFGRPYICQISGCIHDGWLLIRDDKGFFDKEFLVQFLSTDSMLSQYKALAAGSTVNNLNKDLVSSTTICFSKKPEQKALGVFFGNIDLLIVLHQRKLDQMKEIKKSLLQKMFPSEGSDKPVIRFAGFTDSWEQRKLKEACQISTGFPFQSADFEDSGEYLVLTNGNIQDDRPDVDDSQGSRISIGQDSYLAKYILNIGDVLVTMDGTVGRTAKVSKNGQILAQRVGRINGSFCQNFIYQLLNSGEFSSAMKKVSHGGTIKHISLDEIGNYEYLAPKIQIETEKIGAYFTTIDNIIVLHQRKLDELQKMKKSLLQKMFI